jgi:hypothetical protein
VVELNFTAPLSGATLVTSNLRNRPQFFLQKGQSVPVGVGQPTLHIDGLTVGALLGIHEIAQSMR